MRVPYWAGIFQNRTNEGNICRLLKLRRAVFQVPFKETKRDIGSVGNGIYMGDQLNSDVRVTPRYWASSALKRTWPHSSYIKDIETRERDICIIWHLPALNLMPHVSPHRSIAARSCSATWSAMERMGRYMRQSSANNLTWEVTRLGKSLICIKNSRGPKTVPWGTPEITFVGRDLEPSTTTVCSLVFKKAAVQSNKGPCMPRNSNFPNRRSCGTVSKAWEKSKMATSVWIFLSLVCNKSCRVSNGTNNCWFPLARKWPIWKWTWIWIPYGKIEKKCPRYFRRDSRGNPRDLNMCRTGRSAALSRRRKSMPPIGVLMKRESMKLVV